MYWEREGVTEWWAMGGGRGKVRGCEQKSELNIHSKDKEW
jgi:hypothetical protein